MIIVIYLLYILLLKVDTATLIQEWGAKYLHFNYPNLTLKKLLFQIKFYWNLHGKVSYQSILNIH